MVTGTYLRSIDPDRGLLAMRYYTCSADYLPGIEPPADQ